MRNFFWPISRNPAPTGFTRFGRVLHWLGFAIAIAIWAAGIFAICWAIYNAIRGNSFDPAYASFVAVFWFVAGLLVMLVGRALRYVFSGE